MTLSSLVPQSRALLEEQARHLLTEAERRTMGYYVEEYRDGHIGVEPLVMALFELLNTHAKVRCGMGGGGVVGGYRGVQGGVGYWGGWWGFVCAKGFPALPLRLFSCVCVPDLLFVCVCL